MSMSKRKDMVMINTDIEDSIYLNLREGESCRLVHTEKADGTICSAGKSTAMVVTRTSKGLKWFCHRCEESGFTSIKGLSPERTLAISRMIRKPEEKGESKPFHLPTDVIPLYLNTGHWNEDIKIPSYASEWLEKYEMCGADLDWIQQEVYWSPSEKRIIFPWYDDDKKLTHWVGRSLEPGAPKYKTQKRDDQGRVFGTIWSSTRTPVVFCEDIVSAIKIALATEYATVALLTTHIDYEVVKDYKDQELFLWLDGDMKAKSIKKFKRLSNLGFKIKSIRTDKDPKEYSYADIRKELGI